jgi:hypothetical protein
MKIINRSRLSSLTFLHCKCTVALQIRVLGDTIHSLSFLVYLSYRVHFVSMDNFCL